MSGHPGAFRNRLKRASGKVSFVLAVLAVPAFSSSWMEAQAPASTKTIRIWGHGHRGQDYIQTLLSAWQQGFRTTHPDVRFDDQLYGNASGIGALYTGVADLAILDREASFIEVDAYQQGSGQDPFRVAVAEGSVNTPHHAPALKVYVNKANPLARLSLAQLDSIFDADHRLSKQSTKTWGDLGLRDEWATKPIQMYSFNTQSAEMQFFERAALKGSQKFSCCLHLSGSNSEVAAAIARDRFGIAVMSAAAPGLRAIALSRGDGDEAVEASVETISNGTYPLARTVYLYANRGAKLALSPEVKAFLAYVTGPEGQAIAARTGGYLPLPAAMAKAAQEALR